MPDPRREFLLTSPLPEYPWQMVATDRYEYHEQYFSHYPVVSELSTTISTIVINAMKGVFPVM